MSDHPPSSFDDEVLSDVLDGTADDDVVAAVAADPGASARLERLRRVRDAVAAPPPPATADRRAQTIAAAIAVAEQPAGITSLSTARAAKRSTRFQFPMRWAAAAAAAVVLAVGIPAVLDGTRDGDDTTATAEATDDPDGADDASGGGQLLESEQSNFADGDDLAGDRDAADGALADSGEAMVAADSDATTTSTAADSDGDTSDDGDSPSDETDNPVSIVVVSSVDEIAERIDDGTVAARFAGDESVFADLVASACLDRYAGVDGVAFDLVTVDPGDGGDFVVLVYFDDDGSVETLEAEDCTPVG